MRLILVDTASPVLRVLCQSVELKRRAGEVLSLTMVIHVFWGWGVGGGGMTKRMRLQIQEVKMSFLHKVARS